FLPFSRPLKKPLTAHEAEADPRLSSAKPIVTRAIRGLILQNTDRKKRLSSGWPGTHSGGSRRPYCRNLFFQGLSSRRLRIRLLLTSRRPSSLPCRVPILLRRKPWKTFTPRGETCRAENNLS